MKKINLLIIAVLVSAVGFMTSCGDETITPKPVITFTSDNSAAVMPGDSVDITGSIKAEGEIKEIRYFVGNDQYGETITDNFNSKTEHTFNVKIAADSSIVFEVQVTDDEGQIGKNNVNITVEVPETIVKTTTPIKLYTAPSDKFGDEARFASLTTFEGYSWSTAQGNEANIDLMYYTGNYIKEMLPPHFVSANVATEFAHGGDALTGDNTTYFTVLEGDDAALFTDWDNINDDTAINSIAATITDTNVTWSDVAGTIIAFELSDGKKGVIKVGATVDGNNDGDNYDAASDYIEFDVIVQINAPVTK